ncbi:hypothetical protein [Kitasatospora sp. NPDC094011]|uniref:hypothetical protein n=1 Tax=Kitasatospora sp. NPDC094011 TaxID=3364090 RepID=UPI003809CE91
MADEDLWTAVNDARLHPQNYPPDSTGPSAHGVTPKLTPCTSPFVFSPMLSDAAAHHLEFLATQTNAWILEKDSAGNSLDNFHRTPPNYPTPGTPVLDWSSNPPGIIYLAGYHTQGAETWAGQNEDLSIAELAKKAVQDWMMHDARSDWGHRNIILGGDVWTSNQGIITLGCAGWEAGVGHWGQSTNPPSQCGYQDMWTLLCGKP